jgi:NAD(P)-dependent dehydrogenase (short-subunit alcohol dehydrogenase family)
MNLNGKKALITGGSSGFGRSAAELLADQGTDVCINYSSNEEKAAAALKALSRRDVDSFAVRADVADRDACADLVQQVKDRFGRIDILVHSAGISQINDTDPEAFDRVLRVHMHSTHWLFEAVTPVMVQQQSGSIVVLTSIANNKGDGGSYGAAMGAKLVYSLGKAAKLAEKNIRVNCVAPGTVFTEMLEPFYKSEESKRKKTEQRMPLWKNREGIPLADEVGKVILFLVSDLASHVTGEEIRVNGGQFIAS